MPVVLLLVNLSTAVCAPLRWNPHPRTVADLERNSDERRARAVPVVEGDRSANAYETCIDRNGGIEVRD